jgi:uncharacterized phage protein (TIGR02218 family)
VTRTIPAGIAADFAAGHTTLARCLRLDLRDGTSIGITDHDQDLSVNLGDGALTYSSGTGALPSDVSLSIGFDADNYEVRGPINGVVTLPALLGGRYRRARARLFDVDWTNTAEFYRLMAGKVAEPRVEAGEFVMSVRGAQDAYNQMIGRVLSPVCSHDYGDAKCQAVVPEFPATVAAVASDMTFTLTFTGATPTAGQASFGLVEFLTGALAGCPPVEVFALAAGVVSLYAPLAEPPQIGDTLVLSGGCSKLRMSDDPAIVTCLTNNNVRRFGGFDQAPGSAEYLKYAVPGTSA